MTIEYDLYRFNGKRGLMSAIDTTIKKAAFRYIVYLRWYQYAHSKKYFFLSKTISRIAFHNLSIRLNLDIHKNTKIGKGFVIYHPGAIAINQAASLGNNCTIYHGVTIGMEFRGKRKGCPTIGDKVWIGPNATIVGNVSVGNNVLIAPGAFVNCDVPSNSIVIGNPARIIPNDNATEDYITRTELDQSS